VSRPLIEYGRCGERLVDVPVFDVHAHIGDFSLITTIGVDEQVREMDRIGIDVMALSSVEGIYGDIRRGNDDVMAAAQRHPGRIIGYCHVSAQYPDLMLAELERCFSAQAGAWFRGIKVYQVGTDYDHPLFDPVWAFARERGLPVLAHTWATSLTGYDRAAKRFPEVAFMMAHAGSGFAYDTYLKAAASSPNLYLDLTYSREHTNMIEHFVRTLGAGRVLWGSDTPTFSTSQQIGKVLFARISDEEKRMILYNNSARLFGLPVPGVKRTG
jgi:predicted TIM-barrel fold metal-dependent hydrolase